MNDLIRAALALLLLVSCAAAEGFTIPDVQKELEEIRETEADLKGKVATSGAAYLDDLIEVVERRVLLELRLEALEENSRLVKPQRSGKSRQKLVLPPRGGPRTYNSLRF